VTSDIKERELRTVILAGGKGTRLRPYTTVLPKPLMPVGDQPILEILVRQLIRAGSTRITIALGHLANLVQAVLGSGERFGVEIDYSLEDKPLGTSGPLSLIPGLTDTFFVLNGDILTDLDFRDLRRFHCENNAALTIASHRRKVHIDYGVLHRDDHRLTRYVEKPVIDYEVSMGIYVFQPSVLGYIPNGEYLDFPDLVRTLLANQEPVYCYPYEGIWFDLGRPEDFDRAQEAVGFLD
jgi:NDP-mannose synthase